MRFFSKFQNYRLLFQSFRSYSDGNARLVTDNEMPAQFLSNYSSSTSPYEEIGYYITFIRGGFDNSLY